MSHCAMIEFVDGKPSYRRKTVFDNSWGGVPRIWDALCVEYLGADNGGWIFKSEAMFDLLNDGKIEDDFENSVLHFTADWAVLRKENFSRMAADLRKFKEKYPPRAICHLEAWASYLDESEVEAVAMYGTSCGEYLWHKYDEETDEEINYDLNTMDDHFFVYDRA